MKTLFRPVDISVLVLFRIVFGVLGFADVLGTILHKETRDNLTHDFQFKYYGFEWIQPMPEWLILIFMAVMCTLAILIALGLHYRIATLLFALGFTYFNFMEATQYLNHGYLFCWLSWVMCFLPAHRCASFDVQRKPEIYSDTTAQWHIWLLAFLMGIVYFYGGLAKINVDWLRAQPLLTWLEYKRKFWLIGSVISQDWVAWAMSYGGLALDLFAVPLLLFRRTRPVIFVFILMFHFINTLIFQIGIFPLLSIALTLFFFPPDLPRRLFYRFCEIFPKIGGRIKEFFGLNAVSSDISKMSDESGFSNENSSYISKMQGEFSPQNNYVQPSPPRQKITVGILVFIAAFHLLMPLRHHLIPGNVAWTEEGHRYSWRMMLRSKMGSGYFIIKDVETSKETRDYGTKHLTKRQRRKMRTNPELILQYAHFVRDRARGEGREIEIYAHIKAGLNGRKQQPYTDSTVDLAEEKYPFFGHAEWILPFE